MYTTTVTLSGTTPAEVQFGKPYRRINIVQASGTAAGAIAIQPLLPGAAAVSEFASGSNSIDLTAANVVQKIGSNGDQVFSGLDLTPSGLSGSITVTVIAFDSIGL
jgi:hypothetical protein